MRGGVRLGGLVLLLFVFFLALPSIAAADSAEDKLAEIERENALLRKQNAALREQTGLLAENAELQKRARTKQPPAQPAAGERIWSLNESAKPNPAAAPVEQVVLSADLPAAYAAGMRLKAPLIAERGRFQAFVEGGAFWTGGDPVRATFETAASTAARGPEGLFDFIPRRGWDAAIGFDYKFAASLWHVSGQFRYGQANASDSAASSIGPLIAHPFGPPFDFVLNATGQGDAAHSRSVSRHDRSAELIVYADAEDVIAQPDAGIKSSTGEESSGTEVEIEVLALDRPVGVQLALVSRADRAAD
jgi:hypothetical protein